MNSAARESVGSDLCRQLVSAINRRDFDGLRGLFHPEYVDVDLSRCRLQRDTASFLESLLERLEALPDLTVRATVAYARDNRIGIYWMISATQTSSVLGIPPTNRPVRFCGFTTLRVRSGTIAYALHLWDMAGLLRDLRLLADLTDESTLFDSATQLFSLLEEPLGGHFGLPGYSA